MKKKLWITLLSVLLLVESAYYLDSMKQLQKEVRIPSFESAEPFFKGSRPDRYAVLPADTETGIRESNAIAEKKIALISNPSNEFYLINPDYVGWLTVGGTVIDYPVVRGEDNEVYLNQNFYREPDVLGAIFMDYRNIGMGLDQHTIIYGHYTKYGQMFRDLEKYLTEGFVQEQPEFLFKDSFTQRTYRIFSVHQSPPDPRFLAVHFKEEEYTAFLTELKDSSLFTLDVPVTAEDHILTLVTCNNSSATERIYVHAVEVTE